MAKQAIILLCLGWISACGQTTQQNTEQELPPLAPNAKEPEPVTAAPAAPALPITQPPSTVKGTTALPVRWDPEVKLTSIDLIGPALTTHARDPLERRSA